MKSSSFLCISLYALSAYLFTTVNAQVSVNDSLVLADLYNSTNRPKWINHTHRLTKAPVSTWYGITVADTVVTGINLYFNNLIGHIPSSIGNLVHLGYLSLAFNQLSDAIPSSIGNCVNLSSLYLHNNHLSSAISPSIGNPVHLLY